MADADMMASYTRFSADDYKLLAATRLSLPTARPKVHAALCDACNSVILGVRFKCVICQDVDFCAECESTIDLVHTHDGSSAAAEYGAWDPARQLPPPNLVGHHSSHPLYIFPRPLAQPVEERPLLQFPHLDGAIIRYPSQCNACTRSVLPASSKVAICEALSGPVAYTCIHCPATVCAGCGPAGAATIAAVAADPALVAEDGLCVSEGHVLIKWRSQPPEPSRRPRLPRVMPPTVESPVAAATSERRAFDDLRARGRRAGPGAVAVREMCRSDIVGVMEVEVCSFASPYEPEEFNELLDKHPGKVASWVAELADGTPGIAGYIMIDFNQPRQRAHVISIAVSPEARGLGVGKLLMRTAMEHASARSMRTMTLQVSVTNDVALKMYRALGFREHNLLPGYYSSEPDGNRDAWFMWAPLY